MGRGHVCWSGLLLASVSLSLATGCEGKKEPPKPTASAAVKEDEPEPPPAPAPKSAPELAIDESGPRVGFNHSVLTKPDGKPNPEGMAQFVKDLENAKDFIAGKEITLTVHRQTKPEWVTTYLEELGKLAPSKVSVQTETRSDYPKQIKVVPQNQLSPAPAKCSLVGMILETRATAIWRLSGGTARKRDRGMGGPDLTMTGDTIESMAKGCKESTYFFVQGSPGVEWGLIYDLAASALSHPKAGLDTAVVLREVPVAGHSVDLK